jgi:hypothetical protein
MKARAGKRQPRVKHALSFYLRFRGLMARGKWPPEYDALWFPRCASVHTFFTFLGPDLLFLDRDYQVLKVYPLAPPWRFWWGPRGTYGCLETRGGEAGKREWRVGTSLKKQLNREDAKSNKSISLPRIHRMHSVRPMNNIR